MIEIIPNIKNTKRTNEPYYLLTANYMIGDADGETSYEEKISFNNPFIERLLTLADNFTPNKGTWGVCLDKDYINGSFKEGKINENDRDFLLGALFSQKKYSKIFKNDEEIQFASEFHDLICSETEYSFLVFEGFTLEYINEFGEHFSTKII